MSLVFFNFEVSKLCAKALVKKIFAKKRKNCIRRRSDLKLIEKKSLRKETKSDKNE